MESKPTKEELEAMVRDIRAAADEYVIEMRALRAKRQRLFEVWAKTLDLKKAEQIRKQIYGVS
jgi:hypothetical protein